MAFFRNAGQFLGNIGLGLGDSTLGAVGLNNVIDENNYMGSDAERWNSGSNTAGNIAGTGLKIAGNMVAPGIGGAVVSGAQNVGSQFNPQEIPQPYYNHPMNVPNYAQHYWNGGYVKGYANGDFVSSPEYLNAKASSFAGPYNTAFTQGQTPNFSTGNLGAYGPLASGYGYTTPVSGGINAVANSMSSANPYIAAGTLGLGLAQTLLASRGLKRLRNEKVPEYAPSSELENAYSRAQEMSQRGYSPEEENAFKSNLATQQNTAYNQAVQQSGGNLAQAINAGLKSQNINALNDFSARDAALKRDNVRYADSFANQFQNIKDENTRQALQNRMMREQALGLAQSQGLQNLANTANLALATRYGNNIG